MKNEDLSLSSFVLCSNMEHGIFWITKSLKVYSK